VPYGQAPPPVTHIRGEDADIVYDAQQFVPPTQNMFGHGHVVQPIAGL